MFWTKLEHELFGTIWCVQEADGQRRPDLNAVTNNVGLECDHYLIFTIRDTTRRSIAKQNSVVMQPAEEE